MLYLENGEWALPPYKVIYKQHGETLEKYTHDKKWWNEFAEKWDHTEIVEFEDVTYSGEQTARLEEVKGTKEGFEYFAYRYVVDGLFPNELEDEEEQLTNHPFKTLELEKVDEKQGQKQTDTDIKSMLQGQKQSDFEIRLLTMEAK